jgi:hypothetical protein
MYGDWRGAGMLVGERLRWHLQIEKYDVLEIVVVITIG